MAGVRISYLKAFCTVNCPTSRLLSAKLNSSQIQEALKFAPVHQPRSVILNTFSGHMIKGLPPTWHLGRVVGRALPSSSANQSAVVSIRASQNEFLMKKFVSSRRSIFPVCGSNTLIHRLYSSSADSGSRNDRLQEEVSTSATAGESIGQNTDAAGNEWLDIINKTSQSVMDAIVNAGKMAKETSDELLPYFQQMIDSQPCLKDVLVPISGTLSATLLAWLVMPRLLRKLHKYTVQSPLALLSGSLPQGLISYDRSLWSALEDPARYLVTFMAFSQLAAVIVPTTSPYLSQAWRGAVVLSFVWFLHRWKTNVFARALANQTILNLDRDKLIALDKFSSVGLLAVGVMGFAEACDVAVHSILTVGGIGGVATAFAAKDILGNVLNGLSMQFTRPFSVGDNVKAGSIEGQVMEMGLTTTSLINAEKFPVIVPNSLFSSQVIVNKSRAEWRAIITKIPVCIGDLEKIPLVSEDIKSMLRAYPKVFLEKEAPYCFLSQIENSYAELTLGCNLRSMRKDEFYSTWQDIILQAAQIIKKHGAELGSTLYDFNNR